MEEDTEVMRPFVVKRTGIVDSTNTKVLPTETGMFTEELAEHYNQLDCLDIPTGSLFDDKDEQLKAEREENAALKKQIAESTGTKEVIAETITGSEPVAGAGPSNDTDSGGPSGEDKPATSGTTKRAARRRG